MFINIKRKGKMKNKLINIKKGTELCTDPRNYVIIYLYYVIRMNKTKTRVFFSVSGSKYVSMLSNLNFSW